MVTAGKLKVRKIRKTIRKRGYKYEPHPTKFETYALPSTVGSRGYKYETFIYIFKGYKYEPIL